MLNPPLPTDSVLRRHAEAERNRQLGLPPTDSVLQRHHAQLQGMATPAVPAAAAPPRAAAMPAARPAPAPAPVVAAAPKVAPPAAPAGGGLLGWLKRLFGG